MSTVLVSRLQSWGLSKTRQLALSGPRGDSGRYAGQREVLRPWRRSNCQLWVFFVFQKVARGVFLGTRSGSKWLFVALLSLGWLGAFLFEFVPVEDNVHNSRAQRSEVIYDTNCGLHTADVAPVGILV